MTPDFGIGAKTGAPQSLNRYAYVNGDPTNFNDPTGMDGCSVSGFIRGLTGPSGAFCPSTPSPSGEPSDITANFPADIGQCLVGTDGGLSFADGSGCDGSFLSSAPAPASASPINPSANASAKNVNYLSKRWYSDAGVYESAYDHIVNGHVEPNQTPVKTRYWTNATSPGALNFIQVWLVMKGVQGLDARTLSFGTPCIQSDGSIRYTLTFSSMTIPIRTGQPATLYGIGKDQVGKWLFTNVLVVSADCKNVITSFPTSP